MNDSRSDHGLSGRDAAFAVLTDLSHGRTHITDRLDRHFGSAGPDPGGRRMATELACGVIRRRLTLDTVLNRFVSRPRAKLEPGLQTLLRQAVYELVFLATPAHAAVHEHVEVARRVSGVRWTGMMNGVLRSIARELTGEEVRNPAANAVPLSSGRFRVLRQNLFPNPEQDHAQYLSQAFSIPRWLIDRWVEQPLEPLESALFWFVAPPPLNLRINLLRTSTDEFVRRLSGHGLIATAGGHAQSVIVTDGAYVPSLPGFAGGHFVVQDESAMGAATLLDPQPGEDVLDLCAAPGTKTTHLAELMRDGGRILACDVDAQRLALVSENARRLQLDSVKTVLISLDGSGLPHGPFDACLADVPCSNTGVLARRPEARWRIRPHDLVELSRLQFELLDRACERVRCGGRVVYSTCSIDHLENRQIVDAVCRKRGDLTLIREQVHRPGQPADGAYQALLTRTG